MIKLIKDAVTGEFGVDPDALTSKSRKRKLAYARFAGMNMARDMGCMKLKDIATAFNRDHSDVSHALRVHGDLMSYPDYREPYSRARAIVISKYRPPLPDVWAGIICRHAGCEEV